MRGGGGWAAAPVRRVRHGGLGAASRPQHCAAAVASERAGPPASEPASQPAGQPASQPTSQPLPPPHPAPEGSCHPLQFFSSFFFFLSPVPCEAALRATRSACVPRRGPLRGAGGGEKRGGGAGEESQREPWYHHGGGHRLSFFQCRPAPRGPSAGGRMRATGGGGGERPRACEPRGERGAGWRGSVRGVSVERRGGEEGGGGGGGLPRPGGGREGAATGRPGGGCPGRRELCAHVGLRSTYTARPGWGLTTGARGGHVGAARPHPPSSPPPPCTPTVPTPPSPAPPADTSSVFLSFLNSRARAHPPSPPPTH